MPQDITFCWYNAHKTTGENKKKRNQNLSRPVSRPGDRQNSDVSSKHSGIVIPHWQQYRLLCMNGNEQIFRV